MSNEDDIIALYREYIERNSTYTTKTIVNEIDYQDYNPFREYMEKDHMKDQLINNKTNINKNEYMLTDEEISNAICGENDLSEKLTKESIYHISSEQNISRLIRRSDHQILYSILYGFEYNNQIYSVQEGREKLGDVIKFPIFVYKEADRYKFIKLKDAAVDNRYNDLSMYAKIHKIRIKSVELSAAVFGLKKTKEKVLNNIYSDFNIEYGNSAKLKSETYYITIKCDNRNIKFCISDIEFIKPDIKGYNFPKDKSIKKGSIVKMKKKKNNDSDRIKYTVVNINRDAYRKGNSIVTIYNSLNNQELKIYSKHLKVIC